jgi:hypothetical protein
LRLKAHARGRLHEMGGFQPIALRAARRVDEKTV